MDYQDYIKHPAHYTQGAVECKDVCKWLGFYPGNVVKYVWRYKQKCGATDLQKAYQYLEFMQEPIVEPLAELLGNPEKALHLLLPAEPVADQAGRPKLTFFVCKWLSILNTVAVCSYTANAEALLFSACEDLQIAILRTIELEYGHDNQ
jgi:hypothetical protein